jgi:AraC-like DNA-binding protein
MAASSPVMRASLRTLRPLAAGLSARKIDPAKVLRESGVDPALLRDADARIAASTVHALWRRVDELSGDPHFGLRTAMGIHPGSFDVLDYVCRNCATVADGLALYCRYTPLLHDAIQAVVELDDDELRFRHTLTDGTALPRQYAEFIIGSVLVIVRQASGHQVIPKAVYFIHPRPADIAPHRELFRGPITFGAGYNGFTLSRTDAERPLMDAQPGLFEVLEQHAEHLLAKHPRPDSFVAQVRAAILSELRTGSISVSTVARRLGTSERTLRRRLDADETTYQEQLAELRMNLATRYMAEEQLSVDEIALLLGFSDRTSFIRAFRRWTGRSPTEFRQGLAAGCA